MPLAVNEQSEEIKALACEWPVLEALQAGTPAMRKAATTYLPQFVNEEDDAYEIRRTTATLFPAYRRTVGVMAGKPFSEPVSIDAPARIEEWANDIDLQGVNLHSFAAEMFEEAVGFGLAGILVEYPRTNPVGRTVAQVEREGLRPYWVRVKHNQILGFQTETVGGKLRFKQLRLLESAEEPDGPYGVTCVYQVRVLFPGGWELWRQPGDGADWVLHDSGKTTLDFVPFVPLYGKRKSFGLGTPPLLDLAYQNVEHWQSKSDQQNLLRVARVPILCMIGAEDETQLVVGASTAVKLPQDADLKYVEHSGAAIEAGRQSLADLVEDMVQTGAELLVKKPNGQRTASQDNNEAEANKCELQRIAEVFQDSLNQALWMTAQYARMDQGGTVKLFSDYGAANLSDAAGTLIKDLQMAGLLSKRTALKELQRQGRLSPDLDVDDELEAAEADGPPLGAALELAKIGVAANADDE